MAQKALIKGALVTGAAQRLGAIFAESLAAQGLALVLQSYKSRTACQALADSLAEKYQIKTTCLTADLSTPRAGEELYAAAAKAFGGVPRVIVSNAALFLPDSLADSVSDSAPDALTNSLSAHEAQLRAHWAVNYEAPRALTQSYAAACKALPDRLGDALPVIIHLGDGTLAAARQAGLKAYAGSKEALMAQIAPLAGEVAPHLRVVALAPGACLRGRRQSAEHFQALAQDRPLHRVTAPQEVAAAVEFALATPSLTGEILYLDGGAHATTNQAAQDLNYGVEIVRLEVPCRIGWTAAERAKPQRVQVSLTARAFLDDAALRSEALEQVLNYSAIESLVRRQVAESQVHLLERLAVEVLDAVFAYEPRLAAATLTLGKPDIRSDCARLGITLTRHQTPLRGSINAKC